MTSLLCKLGIHEYKPDGIPTRAKGLGGQMIFKTRLVCIRCEKAQLKITKRQFV